jgi:hypothetical protein
MNIIEIFNIIMELIIIYLGCNMILLLISIMKMKVEIKRKTKKEYQEWAKKHEMKFLKKTFFRPIYYIEKSFNYIINSGYLNE